MNDIISCTLQDICLPEKGSIISGPFGSNISSKFFVEKGIPVIRGNNLTLDSKKFIDDGFVFITEEKANELKCDAYCDDLIFTAAGTIGQVGVIPKDAKYSRYVISNKQIRVRLNLEIVDLDYVYCWFSSPWMQSMIRNLNKGSTVPLLTLAEIKSLPVVFPREIRKQKSIGRLLNNLDTIIGNNISICSDLEAIAKLIYDYWFVQFDFPDENGKPYKSSGGKMVWNEQLKREIPEGWIVLPLSNYLNCNQNTITQNNLGEYIAYLDTGSLTENVIDQIQTINRSEGLPSRARRVVKENDILYSTVRPIQKHYGIIKHPAENMIASTGFAVLSAKQGSSYNELFYLFITSENNLRILDAIANNSVSSYPSINPDDILNLKIALPPDLSCLRELCRKLQDFYEMIDAKHKENKELEQLRDFLLPMLMNGQVKA